MLFFPIFQLEILAFRHKWVQFFCHTTALLGLTKLHCLSCALRDSEWIALTSLQFFLFLHVDKWHGNGEVAQQIMRSGVIEIPVRAAWHCTARGGKMHKIGINDKLGVWLQNQPEFGHHSTVSLRACFYVFSYTHS